MVTKRRRIYELLAFALITGGLIFYYGIYGYVISASFSVGYIVRIWTERDRCAYCLKIFKEMDNAITEGMKQEAEDIREMRKKIRLIIDNDKK